MKSHFIVLSIIVAALFCTRYISFGQEKGRMDGHWKLIPEKSASIDPWSHLSLDLAIGKSRVTIVKRYDAGGTLDRRVDSMAVNTLGEEESVAIPSGRWLGQVSMGVYYGPGTKRYVQARMSDSTNELQVGSRETVQTAQGAVELRVQETYALSPDGSTVQWKETRSTRASGPPLTYIFSRVAQ